MRWSFTPAIWRNVSEPLRAENVAQESRISAECKLFHDARKAAISWQRNNLALKISATDFDGTFVSLAVDIPHEYRQSITKRSVLSVKISALASSNLASSLRLNLLRGPNTYENWHALNLLEPVQAAEFELANFAINPISAHNVWLDLMVTHRGTFQLTINSLSISHHQRLEF